MMHWGVETRSSFFR